MCLKNLQMVYQKNPNLSCQGFIFGTHSMDFLIDCIFIFKINMVIFQRADFF